MLAPVEKFLVFIQKMGTDYLLFCELERIKKLQEHLEFFHIIEDVLFVNEKPKELFYILSTNPDEIFSLPEFKTSNHKTPSHSIFLITTPSVLKRASFFSSNRVLM